MSIKFQIGTIERNYTLYETRAPKAYDGFGTLSLDEYDGTRWVLIDAAHANWQIGRYASGMFDAKALTDYDNTAQDLLMKRLVLSNDN